jgi:hypothetical protein
MARPGGTAVKRHLLTAAAEVTLDAARGVLSVVPAAAFDRFRVELDMLEVQHRPRLNEQTIEAQLDELDDQGWDTALVAPILREIANSLRAEAVEPRLTTCAREGTDISSTSGVSCVAHW